MDAGSRPSRGVIFKFPMFGNLEIASMAPAGKATSGIGAAPTMRTRQCDRLADRGNLKGFAGKYPPVKPEPMEIRRIQLNQSFDWLEPPACRQKFNYAKLGLHENRKE
ncbi:MAG: hypothetical protein ABSH22_23295, partial [Tepidisphaeraceae bacterium]